MTSNKTLAMAQPKVGDIYLHCGHVEQGDGYHCWLTNVEFVRPDGSVGTAKWIICCGSCFDMARGDGGKVAIRGDAICKGDVRVTVSENPWDPQSDLLAQLRHLDDAKIVDDLLSEGSALDWCPGLRAAFKDGELALGTRDLVSISLEPPGPAGAIQNELLKGLIASKTVVSTRFGFIVSTQSAMSLLIAHGQAGGRFVAEQMERRAHFHELWTLTIDPEFIDACAYDAHKATFFVSADFAGNDTAAEAFRQEWLDDTDEMAVPNEGRLAGL